ncbi:hypothetical protein IT417_03905 [bacterium]|nr:hypothetical protein [bacterium]
MLFFPLCLKEDLFRPPNTEILVSACKKPVVRGVPGGEVLFVHENLTDKTYLLDLRTGEKRNVPDDPLLLSKGIFLSSELVWLEGSLVGPDHSGYRPHYILDLTDGQRYELLDLNLLPRLEGFKFDPKYFSYFQTADYVFIHHSENSLISFSSDFRATSGTKVIFSQYALSQGDNVKKGTLLENLLKDLGVGYEVIDLSTTRYSDIPSPKDTYIVRDSGIYFSETDTPIVTREYTGGYFMDGYFKSWYYDESGVVVSEGTTYLINSSLFGTYYPISKPVLKLLLNKD